MKRFARLFVVALLPLAGLVFTAGGASASTFTVSPWAYACGHTNSGNPATATATCDGSSGAASSGYAGGALTLSKNGPTASDLASGATIGGLIHVTAISFDVSGYCGAGAPRLNITTSDGKTHFFGCAANNAAGHVSINLTAAGDGSGNGGVGPTDTITEIDFVQDESTCTPTGECDDNPAVLSNLSFTGSGPTPTPKASPTPCGTGTASAPRTACPPAPKPPTTGVSSGPDLYLPIAGGLAVIVLLLVGIARLSRLRI